jgi:hypothetical protein
MLSRIRYLFQVLWRQLTGKHYPSTKISFISDDDIHPISSSLEDIITELGYDSEYRDCQSQDEYNRDFLTIFKVHRRDFLLDYSQRDGHFRV